MKVDAAVHKSLYSLRGFHAPVLKSRTRKGGGVAIYVKNTLPFSRIEKLENNSFEAVWVKIKAQKSTIALCCCYLPPHPTAEQQDEFLDYLADSVSEAQRYLPDLVTVVGDFNAGNCWLPPDAPCHSPVTPFELELRDTAKTLSLTQLITTATRIQNGTHNLRDLAFVDRCEVIKEARIAPTFSKLDHLPLIITLSLQINDSRSQQTTTVWDYSNTNIEELIKSLSETNWDNIAAQDVDEATDLLSSAILHAAEKCIPIKTIKVRTSKPWLSMELRREMRKRDRLFRFAKRNDNELAWTRWRDQRNLVTSLNRRLKNEHLKQKISILIENKKSPYKYHKILKSITGFKRNETLPPLLIGGDIITDDAHKADAFNNYFSSQTDIQILDHHKKSVQEYRTNHTETPHTFCYTTITPQEVIKTISHMDASKACGPDRIPTKLIKMVAAYVAEPLSKIFNKSIEEGIYPTQWKLATVKPVFKAKGSPAEPKSYRPISLLPCLSKIFEKLIFTRIYSHINSNSLLTPKQSGYRPGHNTELQLAYLTDKLYRSLDSRDDYTIIYLDISRYFEKIWHEGLLAKCDKEFGIRGRHLDWLESYLKDRQQIVQIGQATSTPRFLAAGVPQGSVLGPLLAIMYLNGLSSITNNEMLFFADDSSLNASHNADNFEEVEQTLQQDLECIKDYGSNWIITFNETKTFQQTFTLKAMTKTPSLTFGGTAVPISDSHTHLGITMSTDLRFKSHVNQILLKFNRTLSPLYPISHMLPRQVLLHIYKIYVQPHLDYCDTIYDCQLTSADKSRLEKAQNRAARLITATPRRTPTIGLRSELGMTSLETRRRTHRLHLFHKIKFDESVPDFIKEILPNTRQSDTDRNLRSTQNGELTMPKAQTAFFARSLIPATTKLWNQMPNELRGEESHKIFRSETSGPKNNGIRKLYLGLGSKLGNMLHTQIRLKCSALNEHGHKLGKNDSPECSCGARSEDTEHFLLHCPVFDAARDDLFQNVSTALNVNFQELPRKTKTEVLLYGPEGQTFSTCMFVALELQRFLLRTERFARSQNGRYT